MLDTPGKRVYAAVLLVALAYVILLPGLGLYLAFSSFRQGAWFFSALTATTVLTGVLAAPHVAQFIVFGGVLLWRGGRPFVPPPPETSDDDLPPIVVQIPGRNEPHAAVVRSIESVLASRYPAGKIRVQHIDNSDDDRWQAVAERYAAEDRVQVIHRAGTQGFKAGNLNLGAARMHLGTGWEEFLIGLLDAGDTFSRHSMRLLATEMLRDTRLAFVQSLTRVGNPEETAITRVESVVADAIFRFHFGVQNTYGIPTIYGHHVLVRPQALREVGGWDETKIAEDWATGISMLLKGWRGRWVDYDPVDPSIVPGEETPPTLEGQQRQKGRWATGGSELAKQYVRGDKRLPLPWNEHADLVIRLLTYPTALPRYMGMLLLPLWLGCAALANETPARTLWFGLASASLQNAVFLFVFATSMLYITTGYVKRGLALLVCFPIQVVYSLPIAPHVAHGVLKGFRYATNVFQITPKGTEEFGLTRVFVQQRVALAMTGWLLIPAAFVAVVRPNHYGSYMLGLLILPLLTFIGVFLVPLTQRVRKSRLRPGAR